MAEQVTKTEKKAEGKLFTGKVASNKMAKTVVVEVMRYVKHPKYQKFLKKIKRYKAHAEGTYEVGQTVTIQECRPMSKDKSFIVIK
ncbi:MAG: 30S ribosomal protein S17 [Candidatus Pacebacteria bacterium]|nr:30S ribosomal protein S17 [Candidatus Paceibacterota bacterium]MDD5357254.1 30S ribosomal protein S17 [Candidatus Paceibacterota bacterium]